MSISARQTMTGSVETRQSVNGEVSTPINTSVIFQPSVSEEGILSWTNDKGLPNPDPIDISGPPGYTPVKGVDYFDGEPGEPGYTPVKGVDYFDGEPGYTPVKGVDYFDGEPGYTPVKGKDYFDGDKGDPFTYADFTEEQLKSLKGEPGYTPVKGVDYFDGEPGEPGYTPVKGKDYFDGEPGYTPVKGKDYFTEEEKAELTEEVLVATKEEWIALADITIEEDITHLAFDKDMNGQPFELKRLVARVIYNSAPLLTGMNVCPSKTFDWGKYLGDNISTSMTKNLFIDIETFDKKALQITMVQQGANLTFWADIGNAWARALMAYSKNIEGFYIGSHSGALSFPTGTRFMVWGLKA